MRDIKILAISPSGIGNFLLFLPTLRTLRRQYPEAEITVLVGKEGCHALLDNSMVNMVYVLPQKYSIPNLYRTVKRLRKQRFDISITGFPSNRARYNLLSFLIGARRRITHGYSIGFLRALAFLQNERIPSEASLHDVDQNLNLLSAIGIDPGRAARDLSITIRGEDRRFAQDLLTQNGILISQPIVGIHPGSNVRCQAKRWPPERFIELIRRLHTELDVRVVLFLGPDEEDVLRPYVPSVPDDVVWVRGIPLPRTAALIAKCTLLVANDTGTIHIAAAVGTPVIGIFGPTDPTRTAPYGRCHVIVKGGTSCSPCYRYPFRTTSGRIRCKWAERDCLLDVSVEDVFRAVQRCPPKSI